MRQLYGPGHPTWRPVKHMSAERCASKIRHETWASAEEHLLELIEQEHRYGTPEFANGLVTYRCSQCMGWHVGHGIGSAPQFQAHLAERRRRERAVSE